MEIIFILVNPAVPENIGFSLRAMNTMGFTRMRIVGRVDLEADGLRKTAYGSHDLLENIITYPTLEAAINDVDLVVGTTSKNRTSRNDIILSGEIKSFLDQRRESLKRVAIVFGSEENGLSKEEINQCHIVSTIPLKTDYPSLNLAQSVMIYAYELTGTSSVEMIESEKNGLYKVLMEDGLEVMKWLELDRNPAFFQKMKDRLAMTSDKDIRVILSALGKIKHKMKTIQSMDSDAN